MVCLTKKISLMEAYLIETLRANNIKDEEIMQKVKEEKVDEFHHIHEKFDYTGLYALEKQGILEEVLQNGYEIKFLTFTGLVNILRIKFRREENVDYDVKDFTISNLNLSNEETENLMQIASSNWEITQTNSGVTIKPIATLSQ